MGKASFMCSLPSPSKRIVPFATIHRALGRITFGQQSLFTALQLFDGLLSKAV